MKYSIIIPYCKRPELKSSLTSFLHHYAGRMDYEVIIIEDSKNANDYPHHRQLMDIIKEFNHKIDIRCVYDGVDSFNPSKKYNLGCLKAKGEYIILTSPEIFHESNILDGLDRLTKENKNSYFVCACRSRHYDKPIFDSYEEHFNGKMNMWYQHSQMRNVLFHFCSVISRKDYHKVGGFDERYSKGIGFDDESFLQRVRLQNIEIIPVDDLVVTHIEHDRSYHEKNTDLIEVNRKLFLDQLSTGDFVKDFVGVI